MSQSWCWCLLGLCIVVITGLEDFVDQIGDNIFIYHDHTKLLLLVAGTRCYFAGVDSSVLTHLSYSLSRRQLETQLTHVLSRDVSAAQTSTLSEMRDLYQDRLADFHCLDRHVYTLTLNDQLVTTTPPTDQQSLPATPPPSPLSTHITTTSSHITTTSSAADITLTRSASSEECKDRLGPEMTCESLQSQFPSLCQDLLGLKSCPKYCQLCSNSTATTTTETTSSTTTATTTTSARKETTRRGSCVPTTVAAAVDTCTDEGPPELCQATGFCADRYAQIVCRKTCLFCRGVQVCEDQLQGEVSCADLYGPDRKFPDLDQLCDSHTGRDLCQLSCGCPSFCH